MSRIIPFVRIEETAYLKRAKQKVLSIRNPEELAKRLTELKDYVNGLNSLGEYGSRLIDRLSPHIRAAMGPYSQTNRELCVAATSLFHTAYEKSTDKRPTLKITADAWEERLEPGKRL